MRYLLMLLVLAFPNLLVAQSGMVLNLLTTPGALTNSSSGAVGSTSGLTGSIFTASNGSVPSFAPPGLAASSNSPVSAYPYTLAQDSSTAIVDRGHTLRLTNGTSPAVTIPAMNTSGIGVGYYVTIFDESAGAITLSASGTDTINIFNGGSLSSGATSFSLNNGQTVTLNADSISGSTGLWLARIQTATASGNLGYTVTAGQNAGTSATNVTSLAAGLSVNTNYIIHCMLLFGSNTANSSGNVVGGTAGVSGTSWRITGFGPQTTTGVVYGDSGGQTGTSNASILTSFTAYASGFSPIYLDGYVRTGSTASPTFNITITSGNSTDTLAIKPSSVCTYTPSSN